jgi:hypothetical protein
MEAAPADQQLPAQAQAQVVNQVMVQNLEIWRRAVTVALEIQVDLILLQYQKQIRPEQQDQVEAELGAMVVLDQMLPEVMVGVIKSDLLRHLIHIQQHTPAEVVVPQVAQEVQGEEHLEETVQTQRQQMVRVGYI